MSEARVIYSDAVCGLKELADESIDCCVTSPPYYGLRDYGHDGQIGLETSVYEYIERLLAVFREVRRVMKPDGTLWVNIKDSYAGSGKGAANYPDNAKKYKQGSSRGLLGAARAGAVKPHDLGIKPKDLMGIPFILALALRADGWYWRQVILWEKPNAMPESANDRCTDAHEYVLLFAKSKRYYFDYEAIMEPAVGFDRTPPAGGRGTLRPNSRRRKGNAKSFRGGGAYTANQSHDNNADAERTTHGNAENETGLRRRRSVWSIATRGYQSENGNHYATFPTKLAENCILAGCREGGTVLDPFIGSGTVAEVALSHGRNCVGVEINQEYKALIEERIQKGIEIHEKHG